MYKSINRLKKENMNFQPYCLLQSLIGGKPYRIWSYSPNYTETESILSSVGKIKHMQKCNKKGFKFSKLNGLSNIQSA